jgi:hypothetical protein
MDWRGHKVKESGYDMSSISPGLGFQGPFNSTPIPFIRRGSKMDIKLWERVHFMGSLPFYLSPASACLSKRTCNCLLVRSALQNSK